MRFCSWQIARTSRRSPDFAFRTGSTNDRATTNRPRLAAAAFLAVDAKSNNDERNFGKQLFAMARTLGSKDAAVAKALGLKNADESIKIDENVLPAK